MNGTGNQTIHLIHGQHHGTEYHGVFQLRFGHRRGQSFALTQLNHGFNIATTNAVRLHNHQPFWQGNAVIPGHLLNDAALTEQNTLGNATLLTDRRRLNGAWLVALGQDNTLVGRLSPLYQLVTEGRRRQASFSQGGTLLLQPLGIEVGGNAVHDGLYPGNVVHWQGIVATIEHGGGFVRVFVGQQYRQSSTDGLTTQLQNWR